MKVEVGMRPPARRGHRGLRPGGKGELGRFGMGNWECGKRAESSL
jgi:hypothetical protein